MIASVAKASLRHRFAWTVRLMAMELRSRRGRALAGLCASALLVVAMATAVVCFRAWRAGASNQSHVLEGQAQLVALLREDLSEAPRHGLAVALRRLPGVAGVRVLQGEQVLARMRQELGEHSSVLDGVEEGFLPATLEISLQPGDQGVGRADAFASRLRRMEGIADVDVLRTAPDQKVAWAAIDGHHLAEMGLAMGSLAAVLAIGLAVAATRRPSAGGRLMAGFGFTPRGIALPPALTSAACSILGGLVGVGLVAGAWHSGFGTRLGDIAVSSLGAWAWLKGAASGLALAAIVATGLGWWGARSTACDGAGLAQVD